MKLRAAINIINGNALINELAAEHWGEPEMDDLLDALDAVVKYIYEVGYESL